MCPSFITLGYLFYSLTHSLSYIVSCLVRTRVSVKCLDFDIFLEERQSGLSPFQGSYTAVLKVPNLGASAEPRANLTLVRSCWLSLILFPYPPTLTLSLNCQPNPCPKRLTWSRRTKLRWAERGISARKQWRLQVWSTVLQFKKQSEREIGSGEQ